MFMEVSNFSEDENDLVSEIYAILEIEFPDDTFDKRTICNQWRNVRAIIELRRNLVI